MASKRTKLPNSSMKLEPLDLDMVDDFLGMPKSQGSKKDKAIRDFKDGLKENFFQRVNTKTVMRSFLRTALPDGYSRLFSVYDDAMRLKNDVVDAVEQSSYNDLDVITERMQQQLKKLKGKVSDQMYEKLERQLAERREKYALNRTFNRNNEQVENEVRRQQDEQDLSDFLGDFGAQNASIAAASEEAEQERFHYQQEQQSLRDRVEKSRFDATGRMLGIIADGVQRQAAFNDQISYQYQKKHLEISMRSYLALRDIRALGEASLKVHRTAYDALVKNTGLPDHLKMTRAESVQFTARNRFNNALVSRIASSVPEFAATFGQNLTTNLARGISGKAQEVSDLLSSGGEGILKLAMQNPGQAGGQLAGMGLAKIVQNVLMPILSRAAKPSFNRLGNKLGGQHNLASYWLDNASPLVQQMMNDPSYSTGWKGYLQRAAKSVVPQFRLDDLVKNGTYQTIDQQAVFNQHSQRSLTEIIPGYLSRILQETRMIRTGSDQVEREVYDIVQGKFVVDKKAQSNLSRKILNNSTRGTMQWALQQATTTFGADGLSDEAKFALQERLLRDASTNKAFHPEAYRKSEGYKQGTSDAVIKELQDFFDKQFQYDGRGKLKGGAEQYQKLNDFSKSFQWIRNLSKNPINEINRLLASGNHTALRDLGLITTVEGEDRVNYSRLWEMYLEGMNNPTGGPFQGPDEFGPSGPIPPKPDDKDPGRAQKMYDWMQGKVKQGADKVKGAWNGRATTGADLADLLRQGKGNVKALPLAAQLMWTQHGAGLQDKGAGIMDLMRQAGNRVGNELQGLSSGNDVMANIQALPLAAQLAMMQANVPGLGGIAGMLSNLRGKLPGLPNIQLPGFNGKLPLALPNALRPSLAALHGIPQLPFNISSIQERMEMVKAGMSDKLSEATAMGSELVDKADDILTAETKELLVKAEEIRSKTLLDINTQKVVEKIDDITGPVMDRFGKLRISMADVGQGLITGAGKKLDWLRELWNTHSPAMKARMANLRGSAIGLLTEENGLFSRVKDLYLKGRSTPVLLARDMSQGEYFDVNTDKVIETIDDITGEVRNSQGEVVLTNEEVEEGLYDIDQNKVKTRGLMGKLLSFYRKKWLPGVAKKAMNIAGFVGSTIIHGIGKRLFVYDAYLPGQREPVLTARALKRGDYYDDEGNVLKSFEDVRGGIYDAQGNAVVDEETRLELINRDGSKHSAAKKRGFIRRMASKALKAVGRGIGALGKGYYNKVISPYYKWLGGKVLSPIKKRYNAYMGRSEEVVDPKAIQTPTDSLLNQILNTLRDRLPGGEPRKGSWQEKLAAATAKDKARNAGSPNKKQAEGGPLAGLAAGLKRLFGGGEDEEAGDDGDTYIDIGGGDGKGREPGQRKRGWLGRQWDKVKGSKLGRKVAGSRLGKFGAKWGGRIAGSAVGRMGGSLLGAGGRLIAGGGSMLGTAGRLALGLGGAEALGAGATALMGGGASALGAVASGAATVGTAALGAIGTGLAAVGAVLASPVVLTGLAVAAIAAGGYWLYKRHRDTSGDFRELRLLQYGISSTGDQLKILELEALLEPVSKVQGDDVTIDFKQIDPKKLLDIVGVDDDEPEYQLALARWLDKRFKPVFAVYKKALTNLAAGGVLLNEIDDKLPEEQKYAFLEQVKNPGPGIYDVLDNPLGDDDPLEVTPDQIQEKINEIAEKYKDKAKKEETGGGGSNPTLKTASQSMVSAGGVTAAGAKPVQPGMPPTTDISRPPGSKDSALTVAAKAAAIGAAALPFGSGLASAVVSMTTFNGNVLSALQSIRMRAYGLFTVDRKNVQALLSAEDRLWAGLSFSRDGQAEYTGDVEVLIQDIGPMFGISVTDPSDAGRVAFVNWLYYRFVPVALAYFAAAYKANKSVQPSRIDSLKPIALVGIANAIMATTADYNGEKVAVWKVPHIFGGNATGDALKALADQDLTLLNQEAEKEKLSTPTQSANQQGAQAASGQTHTADSVSNGQSFGSRVLESAKSFASGVATTLGGAVDSVKNFFGFGDKSQSDNFTFTPGGNIGSMGNTFTGFTKGNGGQWEQIPLPKSNKSREAAMETLKAVEAITGVSADLLATFCSIESGFDYMVKAATSSATGWFQFINDTWDWMISRYASKYGIPPDDGSRNQRKDPRINALMGAEFLKENYNILASALGRAPTDTDLYMAHFLGAGTAAKFLKMDKNANAAAAFPKQASANTSIFYKAAGTPRTCGEVYALMDEKVAKHRKGGNAVKSVPGREMTAQEAADAQAKAAANGAADGTDNGELDGIRTPGSAGDGKQPTITQVAASTANPLNAPSGTAAVAASGDSGNNTAANASGDTTNVSSGQNDYPLTQAKEQAVRQAKAADKARSEQAARDAANTQKAIDYQAQMLAVQQESRDYLKIIASNMGVLKQQASQPASPVQKSNAMESTSAGQARQASSAPAPISLKR